MLGVTFADPSDYDKVLEDDTIEVLDLDNFRPNTPLTVALRHADGSTDNIQVNHTYNEGQIAWFWAGSALNTLK